MASLAEYVHNKGLLFGLYSDAGTQTCQGRPGSYNYEKVDANTYAKWKYLMSHIAEWTTSNTTIATTKTSHLKSVTPSCVTLSINPVDTSISLCVSGVGHSLGYGLRMSEIHGELPWILKIFGWSFSPFWSFKKTCISMPNQGPGTIPICWRSEMGVWQPISIRVTLPYGQCLNHHYLSDAISKTCQNKPCKS